MAKLYTEGYLEYTAPDGRHWRIWPDGAHLVVPRLEDVQTGALVTLAARDLAAEFFKQQQELAQARALLMLARGLIINDAKPTAVSMWVSKHDAFLASLEPSDD